MVRLVLEEGVSKDYFDNDMILLSKDDPNVSSHTSECAGPESVCSFAQCLTLQMSFTQQKPICRTLLQSCVHVPRCTDSISYTGHACQPHISHDKSADEELI